MPLESPLMHHEGRCRSKLTNKDQTESEYLPFTSTTSIQKGMCSSKLTDSCGSTKIEACYKMRSRASSASSPSSSSSSSSDDESFSFNIMKAEMGMNSAVLDTFARTRSVTINQQGIQEHYWNLLNFPTDNTVQLLRTKTVVRDWVFVDFKNSTRFMVFAFEVPQTNDIYYVTAPSEAGSDLYLASNSLDPSDISNLNKDSRCFKCVHDSKDGPGDSEHCILQPVINERLSVGVRNHRAYVIDASPQDQVYWKIVTNED